MSKINGTFHIDYTCATEEEHDALHKALAAWLETQPCACQYEDEPDQETGMTSEQLRAWVFESLNVEQDENKYMMTEMDKYEIVTDLQMCCAPLEDCTTDELLPHVVAWLESRNVTVRD